ncbi:hypothetical protein C2G38_365774 [Gigaspora rosea]|uniref:Uncharacterized protein n=1 Tax=Gigaspora rosea TaxID=44941 RepID=A0A397UG91_9GLOM|nr:hypothetical protein C2G38_365774 [Gigaspora rosea]
MGFQGFLFRIFLVIFKIPGFILLGPISIFYMLMKRVYIIDEEACKTFFGEYKTGNDDVGFFGAEIDAKLILRVVLLLNELITPPINKILEEMPQSNKSSTYKILEEMPQSNKSSTHKIPEEMLQSNKSSTHKIPEEMPQSNKSSTQKFCGIKTCNQHSKKLFERINEYLEENKSEKEKEMINCKIVVILAEKFKKIIEKIINDLAEEIQEFKVIEASQEDAKKLAKDIINRFDINLDTLIVMLVNEFKAKPIKVLNEPHKITFRKYHITGNKPEDLVFTIPGKGRNSRKSAEFSIRNYYKGGFRKS